MKIIITLIFFTFASVSFCFDISNELLNAISKIESNNNNNSIGDNGKAYGKYQIHKIYVDDVNRIAKTNYIHNDAFNKNKAKEMVIIYLKHYGKRYERLTGLKCDNSVLSRIHNGGLNGYKKQATIKYWNKVKKELGY